VAHIARVSVGRGGVELELDFGAEREENIWKLRSWIGAS